MPNGVPGASSQEEVNEEPPGGVTPEAPAAPSEAMRKQAATARFRKMVLGVTGGPRPSGDEVVLEKHTCGTLKTCKQSVALLNLKTNAAVHECCGRLDDQEGRAFMAADQMGIELVRDETDAGNSRGNEARKLGEEIDELLKEYETKYEKLGVTARKAKQRAREAHPDGAGEKIAAIEAKLVADRAALASKEIDLRRLPDTRAPIKVSKRERPRAPSPPPLSQLQQLAAAVVEAEKAADAADAAVEAADEALSVAESEADRADARLGRLEVRPEHQWPFYINSGDPGDEEGRDKRLAEFERWAAAKKDVDLKVLIEQTRRVQLQAALEQSRECATHWRQACEARTMALQAAATEASLRIRIKELELEKGERLANAPMRKQIMDAAVAAWGPDHSSRPPSLCTICAARECTHYAV